VIGSAAVSTIVSVPFIEKYSAVELVYSALLIARLLGGVNQAAFRSEAADGVFLTFRAHPSMIYTYSPMDM
jgi:hypothetical protein